MSAPRFSVVMPAFDTASMIGGAIASVLAQTDGDFELLVVDDGSTDGTPEVVRSFSADSRVRLLRNEGPTRGPGAARNLAIGEARGESVSMLDSDDLWLPTYLERIGAALDRHPEVGLACCGHWTLEQPPGLVRRSSKSELQPAHSVLGADELLLRLIERNFLVNSTVTVRRPVLVEIDGCRSELPAAVDFDLWLRIAAAGHGAVCVPEPLAVYRVRPGSIQNEPRNELRANESLRLVYESIASAPETPAAVASVAARQLAMVDERLAVLRGERPVTARVLSLRRRAAFLKRAVLRRRLWYENPPLDLRQVLDRSESA